MKYFFTDFAPFVVASPSLLDFLLFEEDDISPSSPSAWYALLHLTPFFEELAAPLLDF